ncbi:hypothetical protein [Pseudarthrobacter albicanus]|uniref:hypothetical protein n=1 Tax=Pseudarthrobacter albicanus TaxID=2823873 RepID=UPI001BA5DF7C|nr:hypothetical protein [Pseudarthrobacter albicanus]
MSNQVFAPATLSMSARALASVAAVLATVTVAQARQLATAALAAPSAAATRHTVREQLPILDDLGL